MRIKICGLHPVRDVQFCIDLGIDFLGFVFYEKSPRNIDLKEINKLKFYNKRSSKFVAVTVNPSEELLNIFNCMDQKAENELKRLKQWDLKLLKP